LHPKETIVYHDVGARDVRSLVAAPPEPLLRLFLRFLRFGALAWGGPVAQIGMIRQELVDEERWITREHFNRILAVYQVLPGPEAHELCVYFGMLSRGRAGGFLAGLGFMLPGFLLMFALSAWYVRGVQSPLLQAAFFGIQPAVIALIVRAVVRIGQHALTTPWLWGIAVVAAVAHLVGTSFWVTLPWSGLFYLFVISRRRALAAMAIALLIAGVLLVSGLRVTSEDVRREGPVPQGTITSTATDGHERRAPLSRLFGSGLRSGLLTFGGAYTVLPFLQHDAVEAGQWMTAAEFLDGVALSGILPAPFIIFSTFVGYLGGGPIGALVLTIGIFLPAFGFTLLAHGYLERVVQHPAVHAFLDGVTAGVVGLIAATSVQLFRVGVHDLITLLIFVICLTVLQRWKARGAVAAVVLGAAAGGLLFQR
jgi:chromate transporter